MSRCTSFRIALIVTICCCSLALSVRSVWADALVIDHRHTDITLIPQTAIEQAKATLHIAYGHTSHGSQLTTGMTGLVAFANNHGLGLSLPDDIFAWNNGGTGGALDLHDDALGGDVGYYPQWVNNTRAYLDDPAHADVNVIIWSWCGQVEEKYTAGSLASEYLTPMTQLEADYPNVKFVYMTGHTDIWDDADNKAANRMIRDYCISNDKILYDFADIEHYDPDGTYFEYVTDSCDYYDGPGGSLLGNWATQWQAQHTEGVEWFNCSSAHSQPLNANLKAYAAWWLWAELAGWNPSGVNRSPVLQSIGDRQIACGQLLTFTVTAIDPDSGDLLTYGVDTLPAGASFSNTTGIFNWTPSDGDEADYTITFSVVDNGSPQASDDETITISVVAAGASGPPDDGNPDDGTGLNSSSSSGCFMDTVWKHKQL